MENKRSDKVLLNEAFKNLRKEGYFAEQSFECCQSCGWHAISEKEAEKKAVFYHQQDAESIKNGKINDYGLYVCWSGNGKQIVDILAKTGLKVIWEGVEGKRILIKSS